MGPVECGRRRAWLRERGNEAGVGGGGGGGGSLRADWDSTQRRYAPQRPCLVLAPAFHLCGLERSVPALPLACCEFMTLSFRSALVELGR